MPADSAGRAGADAGHRRRTRPRAGAGRYDVEMAPAWGMPAVWHRLTMPGAFDALRFAADMYPAAMAEAYFILYRAASRARA